MKSFVFAVALSAAITSGFAQKRQEVTFKPINNNPYVELPLGAIKPQGWLKEMLVRQKNGSTGKMDELYPQVMSKRNGWLGGDGDQWERGPYWIDGLLPLAYILDDKELIAKVQPWIEWSIASQREDGYFGPAKDYPYEAGIQRDNSGDWWPKMVMLKILKQYYSATGDKRVLKLMTNYFKYQLKELPSKPLGHWTYWAEYRAGDNIQVVYWLYNITGDKFLLDLADLIHKQAFDFTGQFMNKEFLSSINSVHCVNLAQGFKEPAVYYQFHNDKKYLESTDQGFADLEKYNGMAHGMYGGDEALHGNNPTQGSELCSAVEMMFSLEGIVEITGKASYADQLEKIAFNALPTQISDDFMTRQYYQQANQVMATRHIRNFDWNHNGTDVVFGLLTGYACCTTNMHQGWPKFTQNLWYSTADNGVAALVYSPSEVTTTVNGKTKVTITEETNYPFEESIRFTLAFDKKSAAETFPFHLRIPGWCTKAVIKINGSIYKEAEGNQIVKINREWKSNDKVELVLPMHISQSKWYEKSTSVERGPLVYALKIGEQKKSVTNTTDFDVYGNYNEYRPTTKWNYGLLQLDAKDLEKEYKVTTKTVVSNYPWNQENAPVSITVPAKEVPSWGLYNEMAGPLPYSPVVDLSPNQPVEYIELIPYGCTTLRISQFPNVEK